MPEESQLSDPYLTLEKEETDWELKYFISLLQSRAQASFRTRTMENLILLFQRYRYNYAFNRRNVAEQFKISENGASQIINKCLEKQIVQKVKTDEYRFVSD